MSFLVIEPSHAAKCLFNCLCSFSTRFPAVFFVSHQQRRESCGHAATAPLPASAQLFFPWGGNRASARLEARDKSLAQQRLVSIRAKHYLSSFLPFLVVTQRQLLSVCGVVEES